MSSDLEERWDEHARLIGRISMISNTVQYSVFTLFHILSDTDVEIASAIFFSLKSDAGQRDLVNAVAKVRITETEELALIKKISDAINVAGRLSGERNAFIHTMWAMNVTDKTLSPIPGTIPHPRLELDRIENQANDLIERLGAHCNIMLKLAATVSASASIQIYRERVKRDRM